MCLGFVEASDHEGGPWQEGAEWQAKYENLEAAMDAETPRRRKAFEDLEVPR